jgi:hypothetical protein
MEEERSPMIDIMGDVLKAPFPEALTGDSSSDASSGGAASDAVEAGIEYVIDLRELTWSSDFGASSITIGRIQQQESLGYFAEDSVREMGWKLSQSQTPMRPLSSKSFLL